MAFDRIQVTKKNPPETAMPLGASAPANDFRIRSTPSVAPLSSNTQSGAPLRSGKQGTTAMPLTSLSSKTVMMGIATILVLGLGTGAIAAVLTTNQLSGAESVDQSATAQQVENAVKVGAVFGVADEKTFRDDTEGVLIKGGIDGEGSHTLLRPGGVSQNVYLTSSVVELDQFDGMKVRIWGETFKGQKAGWLMDVGRLEVKELSADKPTWYTEEK